MAEHVDRAVAIIRANARDERVRQALFEENHRDRPERQRLITLRARRATEATWAQDSLALLDPDA
jgi:hypothetical protein